MLSSVVRRALEQSRSVGPSSLGGDLGLLGLRVATGLLILCFHGWHKVPGAFDYLFYGTPWKLVDEVAEMHFPAPVVSALVATAVQVVCSGLVVAGWFTRLNAFPLAAVLGVAVLQNLLAGRDPQLAVLYTLNLVALGLLGGGRYSLDALCAPKVSAAQLSDDSAPSAPPSSAPSGIRRV